MGRDRRNHAQLAETDCQTGRSRRGTLFDSGHTTHLPAQLYHAHALSPPAPESHPGTGWSQGSTFDGGLYQIALDMAATLAVPFTGDGRDAAEILRTLPPLK